MEDFSALVRRERGNLSMSRAELAKLSGVNVKTITRVEQGHNVKIETIAKVLNVLGKGIRSYDLHFEEEN